jgi:hypothetical protein
VFAIYCYSVATSTYSYRTVVTILVVLVVYGDSSNCSTHLSLLRRFSSLYACFYIMESLSDSVPTEFPFYYYADLRRPEYFLSSSSASESSRWTFSWRSLSRVYLEFNCALNYWVSLVSYSLNLFSHLNSMAWIVSAFICIYYYSVLGYVVSRSSVFDVFMASSCDLMSTNINSWREI